MRVNKLARFFAVGCDRIRLNEFRKLDSKGYPGELKYKKNYSQRFFFKRAEQNFINDAIQLKFFSQTPYLLAALRNRNFDTRSHAGSITSRDSRIFHSANLLIARGRWAVSPVYPEKFALSMINSFLFPLLTEFPNRIHLAQTRELFQQMHRIEIR